MKYYSHFILSICLLISNIVGAQDFSNALQLEKKNGLMCLPGSEQPYTGIYKITHQNGKTMMLGQYLNGLKDGRWQSFDTLGNIKSDEYFVKDRWQGERKLYYANGKLQLIEVFVDGFKNGVQKGYYDTGTLYYEVKHENGVKQGTWVVYHPNGQVWEKGLYKDDLHEGKWLTYNEKGEKTSLRIYEKDKIIKEGYYQDKY